MSERQNNRGLWTQGKRRLRIADDQGKDSSSSSSSRSHAHKTLARMAWHDDRPYSSSYHCHYCCDPAAPL